MSPKTTKMLSSESTGAVLAAVLRTHTALQKPEGIVPSDKAAPDDDGDEKDPALDPGVVVSLVASKACAEEDPMADGAILSIAMASVVPPDT